MNEKILETANYLEIKYACQDALINHKMIAITGNPGFGKTTAINAFKSKIPENVFIVTVTKSMSAKIFYSSILNTFGDKEYKSSERLYFVIRDAIEVFRNSNENKLLIIDEAGRLTPGMIEYLHEFRDATKDNTGIILLGVGYFKSNMINWRNSQKIGIPEFYSRINSWHELENPSKDEIKGIINSYDIDDEDFVHENLGIKDLRVLTNRINDYLTVMK